MKILLVDDSRVVKALVQEMLDEKGYDMTYAQDGQVAIECVQSGEKFDFILLDWNMPVLDGPGFLSKCNELNLDPCPIIMMTTENSHEHFEKAISLGASEYIIKPFTPDILFGKMEMVKGAA